MENRDREILFPNVARNRFDAGRLLRLGESQSKLPTTQQLDFFEKQVRPLLVLHCQECHGAKKQEAGLRFDTHAGFLKGSDGGPVFTAGQVDGSPLLMHCSTRVVAFRCLPKKNCPTNKSPFFVRGWRWVLPGQQKSPLMMASQRLEITGRFNASNDRRSPTRIDRPSHGAFSH